MQKLITELKLNNKGILEFMVLKILASRPYSTQEIFNRLKDAGFRTPLGSLYPLLSRFRKNGYLVSGYEEGDEVSGYKTFELNAKGRERLSILKADWKRLNDLITRL